MATCPCCKKTTRGRPKKGNNPKLVFAVRLTPDEFYSMVEFGESRVVHMHPDFPPEDHLHYRLTIDRKDEQ